jgi:hypothetical protein
MPTSNKARPGGTSLSRPRPLAPPDTESAFLEKLFSAERLAQEVREILDTPRGVIPRAALRREATWHVFS